MKGIGFREYGDVQVLESIEVPTGQVGEDDLLISIMASGVNPVDWKVRQGLLQDDFPYELPLIPGWDASGRVKQVGANVNNFKVGDNVFFRPEMEKQGTYADEIIVPAQYVAPMPKNVNYIEAASFPLVGLTAWQALVEEGKVNEKTKVLILAGSGGVGSFAIQLAKALGAYVCTTTSVEYIDFVKDIGADEVLTFDEGDMHTDTKFDFMLDTLGGEPYASALSYLKENAVVATLISERDAKPAPNKEELEKQKNIDVRFVFTRVDGQNMHQLLKLIEAGKIKPVVSKVFPMTVDGVKLAHLASQTKKTLGKIVLSK